jgi:prepilin-type N-terminal cleavage/methylation domain-containing protein
MVASGPVRSRHQARYILPIARPDLPSCLGNPISILMFRITEQSRRRPRQLARHRGFTLLEASLATVIVGIAFVAVLQVLAAGTMVNLDAAGQTTAVNLARNVRELLLQQSYASLPTYNGTTYAPPHDSRGQPIADLPDWQQTIAVQAVDPHEITTKIVDATPAAVRVTVTISHNGKKVSDLSWYSFDGTP